MKYQRKNKKFWGKRLGLAFFVCLLFLLGWLAPRLPLFCLSEGPVRIYYPYGDQTLARQALTESRVYLREMAAWLGLDAADTAREAPAAELTAGEKDSRPNLVREEKAGVRIVLGGPQPLSSIGSRRRTAGYYWRGLVVICDPESENPPLSHELGHWLLDQAAGGRELPRWFSEGFAQYAEYRLTGFTLPLTDGLTPPLSADTDWAASRPGCAGVFSLSGLDPLFQREDTQLWAYYLSFQAFEKLLQETNWQTIASILSEVRNGTLFADAFSSVTGWDFEIWAGKISSYFVEFPVE